LIPESVPLAQSIERQLIVSVLDEHNEPVMGLQPENFIVREDQVLREVLRINQKQTNSQIALLVDTSAYAENAVLDFRLGLKTFIDMLHKRHSISLILHGGPPRILIESTRSLLRLNAGIDQIFSNRNSAAYLLDAIRDTSSDFIKKNAIRPVIVALTTEGLDHSSTNPNVVLKNLTEAGASLYTLVVRENSLNRLTGDPLARWRIDRDLILSRGPIISGGRRRNLLTSTAIERAMQEIAEEILNQYLVVYSRPNMLIPPEKIEVSVTNIGMHARGTPINIVR
jgi:hypothetical protein